AKDLRPSQDRIQRRSELMGQSGKEIVFRPIRSLSLRSSLLLPCQELLVGFLCMLLIRNVSGDLRCANDSAVSVMNGGDRQRDIQTFARLGHSHGFVVLDTLSTTYPAENMGLLLYRFGRNQHRNRSANRFGRTVSEEALRRRIPRLDDTLQIFTDDRVVGRCNNRPESTLRLVSPFSLDGEGHVASNDPSRHDLRFRELMRGVVVRHELSQETSRVEQRKEGERPYPLGQDRRPQTLQALVFSDVGNQN